MVQIGNKLEIGRELMTSVQEINKQMVEVKDAALRNGISPFAMIDASGSFLYGNLLVAKVQALHALMLLNQKE